MGKKEKREFIRLKAYHLAKYRPLSPGSRQAEPILASLKDISAGGVCLKTELPLDLSTTLELKINFPPLNNPVSCLAKVVWVKKTGKPPCYEAGLQFVDLDQQTRKAIDAGIKFVKDKLNAS